MLFSTNQQAVGNRDGRGDYAFAHVVLAQEAETVRDVRNQDDAVLARRVELSSSNRR